MQNEWLDKIRSPLRPARLEGWNEALLRITEDHMAVSWKERQLMTQVYRGESDSDVKQKALETLIELAVACPRLASESSARRRKKPEYLIDWLWNSFQGRSAVLNVSDPRQLRRDESTLFTIGRCLALREFPDVQAHSIDLDDPHWQPLRVQEPASLCIIGRLGLYGAEALEWWSLENPRFSLVTYRRPPHLGPGDLDPHYHCLTENLPDRRTRRYQTRDEDGRRTDYCLVQRYVVTDGTRQVVVVNCAGPTSLGTQGSVTWAANELARPAQPDGKPIPAPKKLKFASRLEALLEITAEITSGTWSPNPAKLIQLRVDDLVWNEEANEWRPDSPGQIRVILQDGDPDRPVAILLDGKESKLDRSGQAYRLLARLAWRWHNRHDPTVGITIQQLAKDVWIWGGEVVDEQSVRDRLKQVKQRYLRDALLIDDSISLLSEVVIEKQSESEGFAKRLPIAATASSNRQPKASSSPSKRDRSARESQPTADRPRKRPR